MKITFRQIDAFRQVVSTGSVTAAAEHLGVSQPAVSRLISDLEAELGYALFDRSGRVLTPTEEARLLLGEVRQVVAGMEHIKEAAAEIGRFGHARLNIVATPANASQLAPDLVGAFARAHPAAMVRLDIEANDDTIEWLVSQNFDFGITGSPATEPSFECHAIRDEHVYCVLPEDHRLAGRAELTPEDLAGESFVSYASSSRFRFEIDTLFRERGIERRTIYETRTTDAICRLVARGLGIGIVGASESYLASMPGCAIVPFQAPLRFRAFLIWARNRPLSAVARTFLDLAVKPPDGN
jgi:DNA-binding transcriptional LysR family regulator